MKRTIAVIGSSEQTDTTLVSQLAALGYPLLLADDKSEQVKECILGRYPDASVEVLDCSHECVWQADLIVLYLKNKKLSMLERLKEVATGKLVIHLTEDLNVNPVQQWLLFSKVVQAQSDIQNDVVLYTLKGEREQAVEQAMLLFDEIGFKSIIREVKSSSS